MKLGLYDHTGKWRYLREFVEKPQLPLEDLVKLLRAEKSNFETREKWLRWLRDQIELNFEQAHAAIIEIGD